MKLRLSFISAKEAMNMESGYKTRQRELILDFLTANKERHLSVDEMMDYLRGQKSPVGKSTIYRYLDRLVEQGRVRKYFLEEGKGACFQYADDPDGCSRHFHLKCTGCGQLIHVECNYLSDVEQHMFKHHQFTIDNTKTVLYGQCEACSARLGGDCPCKDD
ncbi:Fur family transcriptional regulator [Oscillospiraceae bacterium PP1C4]